MEHCRSAAIMTVLVLVAFALPVIAPSPIDAKEMKLVCENACKGAKSFTFETPKDAKRYRLLVVNGGSRGNGRVSSATIILNGHPILGPNDFNQNVAEIKKELDLSLFTSGKNVLETEVRGKPTASLAVTVTAEVPDQVVRLIPWYRDFDMDGYGGFSAQPFPDGETPMNSSPMFQWVAISGDCNDRDPNVYPGMMCPPMR